MEEKDEIKQESVAYTQMPNKMTEKKELRPKDCLIYLAIKSHLNQKTKLCNPGLSRLKSITDASINTIKRSIRMLMDQGYIDRVEYGNGYNYIFASYTNFEPFTYDFLYNKSLNFREKSYLASVQQYMKIDKTHYGKILFSNYELSDRLNISYDTLMRIEEDLIGKGIMCKLHSGIKDSTGCERPERLYKLDMIGQGCIYELKYLSEKVDENTKDVDQIKVEMAKLKNRVNVLENQLKSTRDKKVMEHQHKVIEKDKKNKITL